MLNNKDILFLYIMMNCSFSVMQAMDMLPIEVKKVELGKMRTFAPTTELTIFPERPDSPQRIGALCLLKTGEAIHVDFTTINQQWVNDQHKLENFIQRGIVPSTTQWEETGFLLDEIIPNRSTPFGIQTDKKYFNIIKTCIYDKNILYKSIKPLLTVQYSPTNNMSDRCTRALPIQQYSISPEKHSYGVYCSINISNQGNNIVLSHRRKFVGDPIPMEFMENDLELLKKISTQKITNRSLCTGYEIYFPSLGKHFNIKNIQYV